ncbi:MAG TPA: ADOP family duplicated permease [Bryobacteraceae bacterium]|jgi:predicted permease
MTLHETVLHDLRYGFRMLARNPGATFITVLALALGIGVNTAVFTGFKAMVARPIEARDPGEMVNFALKRDTGTPQFSFSNPDYEALRDSVKNVLSLIAYRPSQLIYSEGGGPRKQREPLSGSTLGRLGLLNQDVGAAQFASVFVVSENYFQVLGIKMLQGRSFESMSAAELASTPPVLISENFWQRQFNGDRSIIGKPIYLNGAALTIIGITPHDFVGTSIGAPAFWMPISAEPLVHGDEQWLMDRENQSYRLFGRLAPGVSMTQVEARLNPIADHLRSLHAPRTEWAKPATALVWPGSPFPLPLKEYGGLTLSILLTMAAAAMVLVVACANVASLQLARARARENELRTRMSLGASRLRVIRQLITESALVGILAGGVALLLTWTILKFAVVAMSNAIPGQYGGLIFDVTPDLEIFGFVSAASLFAGMLSGFVPAMESSRSRLAFSTAGGTAPARSRRLQDVLVAAQVALSMVLMIAGSVTIRSSIRTVAIDTGFETERVFALNTQFPDTLKYAPPQRRALIAELRRRLDTLPGIASVTTARAPTDAGARTAATTLDENSSQPHNDQTILLHYTFIEPNYFETLSVPITLGRTLPERSTRAVVVSESAARDLWPGQSPIGRMIRLGPTDERSHAVNELLADGPSYQVVGVARDTRAAEFRATDYRRVYLAMPAERTLFYPLLIRTRSDPQQVIASLDPVLTSIDPNIVASCTTLVEMLHQTAPFIAASMAAFIATSIGLVGLLLALMGIYGTVSFIVVLRTREVGIRMAIGARKSDVLSLILRESARPVFAGLLAGGLLAAGASHLARGLLFGLNGVDVASLAGVSLLFLIIGLLASYPPAHRATSINPVIALRYE